MSSSRAKGLNCNCSATDHCKPTILYKKKEQLMKKSNVKPPRNITLPEELLVAQLIKKLPAFSFRIVFASARH